MTRGGLILLLMWGGLTHALTLDDFRHGKPILAQDRVAEFLSCNERLQTWSNAEHFERAEEFIIAARVYFERWRNAESGVDFAAATVEESIALNATAVEILNQASLPPGTAEIFNESHQRVRWLQLYLGYAATPVELRALEAEIHRESDALPYDKPPAAETVDRLLHHIMLLTQQAHLARERGESKYRVNPDTLVLYQQLRGIMPEDL